MTIGELMATLRTMDHDDDVFVTLFAPDGTGEPFDNEAVQAHDGEAQLDIYAGDEGFDGGEGNGAVHPEDEGTPPCDPRTQGTHQMWRRLQLMGF